MTEEADNLQIYEELNNSQPAQEYDIPQFGEPAYDAPIPEELNNGPLPDELDNLHKIFLLSKINYERHANLFSPEFESNQYATFPELSEIEQNVLSIFSAASKEPQTNTFLNLKLEEQLVEVKMRVLLKGSFKPSADTTAYQLLLENLYNLLTTVKENIEVNLSVAESLNTIGHLVGQLDKAEKDLRRQISDTEKQLTFESNLQILSEPLQRALLLITKQGKALQRVEQFELLFMIPEEELANSIKKISDGWVPNFEQIKSSAKENTDFFNELIQQFDRINVELLLLDDSKMAS